MPGLSAESLPLVARAAQFAERMAVVMGARQFSYRDLLERSGRVATSLLDGRSDLQEARVGFVVPPGFEHVAVQWGIWRAGGIAVPLATMHPPAEWAYTLQDAGVKVAIGSDTFWTVYRRLRLNWAWPLDRASHFIDCRAVTTCPKLMHRGER